MARRKADSSFEDCTCGKRRYTKQGAKSALRRLRQQQGDPLGTMHIYRCPTSACWHMGHPSRAVEASSADGAHVCACGYRSWTPQGLAAHACPLEARA